jgi:predicted nucleic acid-binding protein
VDLLEGLVEQDEVLAASELVRFELLAGVRPSEQEALERFFASLVWLAVDESVTRTAGELARRHRKAFSGIDDVDYLIAATAILYEADLLTTNARHFPMLPDVSSPY